MREKEREGGLLIEKKDRQEIFMEEVVGEKKVLISIPSPYMPQEELSNEESMTQKIISFILPNPNTCLIMPLDPRH